MFLFKKTEIVCHHEYMLTEMSLKKASIKTVSVIINKCCIVCNFNIMYYRNLQKD